MCPDTTLSTAAVLRVTSELLDTMISRSSSKAALSCRFPRAWTSATFCHGGFVGSCATSGRSSGRAKSLPGVGWWS